MDGVTDTRPLAEGEDPLSAVEQELARYKAVHLDGLPRFVGGAVGTIGYDVMRCIERLPETASTDLDVPDLPSCFPTRWSSSTTPSTSSSCWRTPTTRAIPTPPT